MDVLLSDRAFIGLALSVIEVYKNECLGSLLGYNLRNRIVVDYVLPYQTAKRKFTEVEPDWQRESRVQEVLPELIHLKHVGYFHSHTQFGTRKAEAKPSQVDTQSMVPTQIEIIVALNDSTRRVVWDSAWKGLRGTIGEYYLRMACYYKTKSGGIRQYPLLCPYVLGFDLTFT